MATRHPALVTVGALTVAVVLGWGISQLRDRPQPTAQVQIEPVSEPAWRVNVEEMRLAEAVGAEASESLAEASAD
jgi:hypothetical protein